MHTGVNKKQNNFEHFLTLSFSSFQGHNSVNFCPKSTSRTIFQHLRCRPFHSYQQKRSHWLKTLQKSDWTKSPSLCATYCTTEILQHDVSKTGRGSPDFISHIYRQSPVIIWYIKPTSVLPQLTVYPLEYRSRLNGYFIWW